MEQTPVPASARPTGRWQWLSSRFGIDTRALAALRIMMGALILVDLFYRAFNLTAFYTDHGVFPRSALLEIRPYFHGLSLHALSGDLWLQVLLLLLLALAAGLLLVGYRTRLATAACFVLLGSLHARNPFILNSGDSLLLILLFWGFFLPLGTRWSFDALRMIPVDGRVADLATAAILLQVVLIYSMNAFFKFQSGHWVSGDAMVYTFNIDRFSTPLGRLLAHAPPLLVFGGWFWLVLLSASVLLLLTTGRTRSVVVALFLMVHLGMFLFMRLGVFPLVSMAALLSFLPKAVWDHFEHLFVRPLAQSRPLHWIATRHSTGNGPSVGHRQDPAPVWVRWARPVRTPAVAVLLALLLLWSGFSLGVVALPDGVQDALKGHERGWAMFANPGRANIWYVAPAITLSNQSVDALHGELTPWANPAHVDPLYPDIRWRKYLAEFHRIEGGDLINHFAVYLCHRWNTAREDPIAELTIYRLHRPIDPYGQDPPGTERLLVVHECAL